MKIKVRTIVACDLSRVRSELRQFSGLRKALGIVRKEMRLRGAEDQRNLRVELLYPFFVEHLLVVIPESELTPLAQASDAGSEDLGANLPGIILTLGEKLDRVEKALAAFLAGAADIGAR